MTWSKTPSTRMLAFSCVHHPVADPKALEWLHAQIEEFRPNILINLGDWYDGEGWSRWDNENAWTTIDEYRAARDHARILNSFTFIDKHVWLYGNHEANREEPGRVKKSLRGIVHWKDWSPEGGGLRDEVKDWKIISAYGSDVVHHEGQITFTHGTKVGINATADEAKMHGSPHGLLVAGHTHRPKVVDRLLFAGGTPSDYWFTNPGTLMDWNKAHYMRRLNFQAWGHGCTLIESYSKVHGNRTGHRQLAKKNWDAETRIFQIARDTR